MNFPDRGRVTSQVHWCDALFLMAMLAIPFAIHARMSATWSLWTDEYFTLRLIGLPLGPLLTELHQDVHPPLYFLFAKLVATLFGSRPEALRWGSFALFGLTLVVVFATARTALHDRWKTYLSTATFALSTSTVYAFWEIRPYALGTVAMSLCFFGGVRLLRSVAARNWLPIVVGFLLGIYSFHLFWLVGTVFMAVLVLILLKTHGVHSLRSAWIPLLMAILLSLPSLALVRAQSSTEGGRDYPWSAPVFVQKTAGFVLSQTGGYYLYARESLSVSRIKADAVSTVFVVASAVAFLSIMVSAARRIRRGDAEARVVLLSLGTLLLVLLVLGLLRIDKLASRYLACLLVPFSILVGSAARGRGLPGALLVLGLNIVCLGTLAVSSQNVIQPQGFRQLAEYLRDDLRPDDRILVACDREQASRNVSYTEGDILSYYAPDLADTHLIYLDSPPESLPKEGRLFVPVMSWATLEPYSVRLEDTLGLPTLVRYRFGREHWIEVEKGRFGSRLGLFQFPPTEPSTEG